MSFCGVVWSFDGESHPVSIDGNDGTELSAEAMFGRDYGNRTRLRPRIRRMLAPSQLRRIELVKAAGVEPASPGSKPGGSATFPSPSLDIWVGLAPT